MGYDVATKQDFGHRRDWIRDRLEFLAGIFLIDVIGYGVLSNHYHAILRNRPDRIEDLSNQEIALRIWRLRHETDASYTPRRRSSRRRSLKVRRRKLDAIIADERLIAEYRRRLSSISWFMNHLNHSIALRANEEDKRSGHFWEGRFVSEPIKSLEQLFSAMVYIDLNPVRAGLAMTPEASTHTSIFDRLVTLRQRQGEPKDWAKTRDVRLQPKDERSNWVELQHELDAWLSPIDERDEMLPTGRRQPISHNVDPKQRAEEMLEDRLPPRASDKGCLPMTAQQYVTLVDWMGRRLRADKQGAIPDNLPPILQRLGLDGVEHWLAIYDNYEQQMARIYRRPVNTVDELAQCQVDSAADPSRVRHAFR
jgi:hypothetical protein